MELKEDVKFAFGLVIFIFSVFAIPMGFIAGAVKATKDRKCEYASAASYFPAHVLGCELFKERWSK